MPIQSWLGFKPHIPVFDNSARRDGTFERAEFTYDHEDDSYVCPGGKRLRRKRCPDPILLSAM